MKMKRNGEGYKENKTQKDRLLEVLQQGKKVCQIDLNLYLYYRTQDFKYVHDRSAYNLFNCVDAIADLGIANLPARIYGLREDGYDIISEDIKCEGRFGKTHYSVYYLAK